MSLPTKTPLVSVIMPVRNEAAFIERSLHSVLAQEYPPECLEILIIDGQSYDDTYEIVQKLIQNPDRPTYPKLHLLSNPKRIIPSALNIGLRHAQGDIIMRMDGHCEVPADYIRQCIECMEVTGADNVGGMIHTIGETGIAQAIALATNHPFGIGNAKFRYGAQKPGYVDTVFPGFYRRASVMQLRGFNEHLTCHEDYELNTRLRQAGGKIYYTPTIAVRYYSRNTFVKLAQQYFRYGIWKARVTRQNSAVLQLRHLVAPGFALFLLLGALLSPFWSKIALAYSLFWLIYLTATLLVAGSLAQRHGWKYAPVLPVAFATLHISWGLGFWWGLVQPALPPPLLPASTPNSDMRLI